MPSKLRFQVAIQSLTTLLEHLSPDTPTQLDEEERSSLETLLSSMEELIGCCRSLHSEWEHQLDVYQSRQNHFAYCAPIATVTVGRRGRPRFEIGREQLEYLSSLGFTWTNIANLLGVSRMTLYRRRRECGLLLDPENTLTDRELETVLRQMRVDHPTLGETMV